MHLSEPQQRPSHCTCGTRLVEDARFCHRCGRPVFGELQFEDDEAATPVEDGGSPSGFGTTTESRAAAPSPALETPAYDGPPEPIDLRNRTAVRLAFFAAAMLFPLVLLPVPLLLKSVLLAGGGFFASWMYQRRTQTRLGYLNAFRLGWISGLMLFLLVLGFYAIGIAIISFSGGNLLSQLMEGMQASGAAASLPEEQLKLMQEVFSDGAKLFMVLLVALFLVFLYFTALAGLGGAIAARLTRPGHRAS